jgi:hypothetical protein
MAKITATASKVKSSNEKCIPGFICVGNMTLFLFMILIVFIFFLVYRLSHVESRTNTINIPSLDSSNTFLTKPSSLYTPTTSEVRVENTLLIQNPISTRKQSCYSEDPLTNPYVPPEKNPIAIKPIATQPYNSQYSQVGILSRKESGFGSGTRNAEILPLMGRRQITTRDKWQYYTVAGGGSGNFQTKLPITVNGRKCSGEYGCNEIDNNDMVYVEGYKDIFIATIYENNTFHYTIENY